MWTRRPLPPELEKFVERCGFPTLSRWCEAAGVPKASIMMARSQGRPIPRAHVAPLLAAARITVTPEELVAALLIKPLPIPGRMPRTAATTATSDAAPATTPTTKPFGEALRAALDVVHALERLAAEGERASFDAAGEVAAAARAVSRQVNSTRYRIRARRARVVAAASDAAAE